MRIPYWGTILFFLVVISNPVFAQEDDSSSEPKVDKDVQEAYDAYEGKKYAIAIELLKDAFSEVRGREDKSKILYMLAESYYYTGDYPNAKQNYQKAYKLGYKDAAAQLHYAEMLKMEGEYEEALIEYREFKKSNPSDTRADEGIQAVQQAIEWQNSPSLYQVSNMKDINSSAMDFAPAFGGKMRDNDVLIFVSGREESTGRGQDEWTGESFMDLYITEAERKDDRRRRRRGSSDEEVLDPAELKWSTPVLLDEEEILNSEEAEGVATFDSRKKTLYFTKCISEEDAQLECGIWSTEMVGQSWKQPERLIFGGDTLANVGHPSLSPDDNFLYFVSDAFNARGKHDIFVSTYDRRSRTWNNPQNLGPAVNTEGEEYYPFAHDDGHLYFASDAHMGMGGLDIYRIKIGENGLPAPGAKAENMKAPINSSWDDFALIFESGGDERGYFSSNRKGSQGQDDIYSVFKTPMVFELRGTVISSKNKQPLSEVTVKLDGSDGTSVQTTTDGEGIYVFDESQIAKDVQYTLSFEKKKFLSGQGNTTTIGIPMSAFEYLPSETKFKHVLQLDHALDPIEEPIVLPNVFFDTGKWDLRPEARAALDTVVMILNNNPTIVIELRSHTDYRDTDQRNKVLSQNRADTSVSYIASKGIARDRLVPVGRGEEEPFFIPEGYDGYGAGKLPEQVTLTEAYIKGLRPEQQEIANQINRRTDFKVLRDDYVPKAKPGSDTTATAGGGQQEEAEEEKGPGQIYIVEGRESFGVIARKNNISIVDLKRMNGGLRGVRPFEGLQLKVEVDGNYEEWDATHYQVQRRGESLRTIAKQMDLDDDALDELNPEVDKRDDLQLGYWVRIK